jgi:hypothetical protein
VQRDGTIHTTRAFRTRVLYTPAKSLGSVGKYSLIPTPSQRMAPQPSPQWPSPKTVSTSIATTHSSITAALPLRCSPMCAEFAGIDILCSGSMPSAVINTCNSQCINCVDSSSATGLKLNSAQVQPKDVVNVQASSWQWTCRRRAATGSPPRFCRCRQWGHLQICPTSSSM